MGSILGRAKTSVQDLRIELLKQEMDREQMFRDFILKQQVAMIEIKSK